MIISLRGSNGSGKSTLVRDVMRSWLDSGGTIVKVMYPPDQNKRVPLGYICISADETRRLFIVGHYGIPNGGVDTVPSLAYAYDLAVRHHELGSDVLMEGKNFTEPTKWLIKLHERGLDVRVVLLDIPIEECIASVRKRGHKIQEKTIRSLHAKSRNQFEVFSSAGLRTHRGDRRSCLERVQAWLKS